MEWIVYEKQYTLEDIGGEIHKKTDLYDIYVAFSQTQINYDEENMKGKKMRRYIFGEIIQSRNIPCYKIESGGRITVFWNIIDRITNREVTFESKLVLNKVRSLTEIEMFTEKSSI